jgi:hypothetical protein
MSGLIVASLLVSAASVVVSVASIYWTNRLRFEQERSRALRRDRERAERLEAARRRERER